MMTNKEAANILELERDDWETSHCTPSERKEAFNAGIKALKDSEPKFSLQCLMCKGAVGVYSRQTMEQVSYTHYSYCEDCLRKGLKLLKGEKVETDKTAKAIDSLKEEIAKVKRAIKSANSDYLTGYISALSGVEGLIAEVEEKLYEDR